MIGLSFTIGEQMYNSYNYNFGTLILRLFLGFFMLLHGYAKLKHGIGGIESILTTNGLPTFLGYGVYIGEVLAPILLIIGFKVRFAALIIIVNILAAIYLVHPTDITELSKHGGLVLEVQYFYIFTSLAILFLGSGRYGIDKD